MKVKKEIREINGRILEKISISDCKYKTFGGAVRAIEKYIGSGAVESWLVCGENDDPEDFEQRTDNGTYIIRHGNDVSVKVVFTFDCRYEVVFVLDFTTDYEGKICHIFAVNEI